MGGVVESSAHFIGCCGAVDELGGVAYAYVVGVADVVVLEDAYAGPKIPAKHGVVQGIVAFQYMNLSAVDCHLRTGGEIKFQEMLRTEREVEIDRNIHILKCFGELVVFFVHVH